MAEELVDSQVKKAENGVNVIISIDKEALSQAIEKGMENLVGDFKETIRKQTQLFAFSALGITVMLALIALMLSSYRI